MKGAPGSPRIAVLLSTYNGEAFLGAQLDSLLAQASVAVEVLARDDGSTDGTIALLARYAQYWPQLASPLGGANVGPARSFLELLRHAPDDFDYYAFCDQDDVWMPDKLRRAAEHLGAVQSGAPTLYCSQVVCVDRALGVLGPPRVNRDSRFEHLLFENIAYGNTVVMSQSARNLINARIPERGVIMHDWWCALVISAVGQVIYDDRPGVLYRQHQANSIGATQSRLLEIFRLVRLFFKNPDEFWPVHGQARELLRLYGDQIEPRYKRLAESFVRSRGSLLGRIGFAASGQMVRSNLVGALAGRMLVLAGWY